MKQNPLYLAVRDALQAAHDALYAAKDKGNPVAMSHGPFSGVNFALGTVCRLENENIRLTAENEEMKKRLEEMA